MHDFEGAEGEKRSHNGSTKKREKTEVKEQKEIEKERK
jgi:hypothetical protein